MIGTIALFLYVTYAIIADTARLIISGLFRDFLCTTKTNGRKTIPWEKSIRICRARFNDVIWERCSNLLRKKMRQCGSFPTSHTRYVKIANYSLLPAEELGWYTWCASPPLLLLSLHHPLSFLVFLSSSCIHRSFLALFVSLVPFCPDGRNSGRELVPSPPVGT